MKAVKDFRATKDFDAEDKRKGTKLPPIRKSGKEKYNLYGDLDYEEDDTSYIKRESVLDYFDDEEDDL